MTVETVNGSTSILVIVKVRNLEDAESLASELEAQGLRTACLVIPANVDLCSQCGPMLRAQKTAFMEGVITAAIMGALVSAVIAALLNLF